MPDRNRAQLTTNTVGAYLFDAGLTPQEVRVTSLGGGVSNRVFKVTWSDGCLVIKQPLANLAVDADWPAAVERVNNEAAALRAYASAIEQTDVSGQVPAVIFASDRDHVLAIECVPSTATMWKQSLLDGHVDTRVATSLGLFLGTVQTAMAGDDSLEHTFADQRPFQQLRLDPYHRTVAERHPSVAPHIEAELDRMDGVRETLVHGDFSPKNVLIDPNRPSNPWILDCEVAHWGDPAFDVAFMLNHLFLKAMYRDEHEVAFIDAATAFWSAYDQSTPWDVESATVTELGILMLARIDGKSPVEYITNEALASHVRSLALTAITTEIRTIDRFIQLVTADDIPP